MPIQLRKPKPPGNEWFLRPSAPPVEKTKTYGQKFKETLSGEWQKKREAERTRLFGKMIKGRVTWQEVRDFFRIAGGPALVIGIDEYIRERGLDPHGITHFADIAAALYGSWSAVTIAKRRKMEKFQKERREKEDVVKQFIEGRYSGALQSSRLGQYPLLLRDESLRKLTKYPLPAPAQPGQPGPKAKRIILRKLKQPAQPAARPAIGCAQLVGDLFANETSMGAKQLYPELLQAKLLAFEPKTVQNVVRFNMKRNPRHTEKAVGLAKEIVNTYGPLIDMPGMPPVVKERMRFARDYSEKIVEEARRERIQPVKVVPPKGLDFMLLSERMENILKAEKRPDVEFAKMLQFVAGTIR